MKQMSEKLNQPPTKLYYHVSELEAAGVVKLVGTRVKSGIIEKYYRIAAQSMQVDRSLLNAGEGMEESMGLLINSVFTGDATTEPPILITTLMRITV